MSRLRERTAVDVPVVIGWVPDAVALFRFAGPALTWPLTPAQMHDSGTALGTTAWVMDDVDGLAGHVQLAQTDDVVRIGRVLVDPAKRGQGLGRRLVVLALEQALRQGAARVDLSVVTDNHGARRLYESLGFQAVGDPGSSGMISMSRAGVTEKRGPVVTSSQEYAHLECERRFLLDRPPDAVEGEPGLHIEDRYLTGTRLRLRTVRRDGQDPVYKLGQKIRVDPAHPSTVAHTTLYLTRAEHEALRHLDAATLTKTRTVLPWFDLTLAVDVFAGELEGLVLAEVDLGDPPAELPATAVLPSPEEVTDDERFTGGALARTSREQLRTLLARRRS